MHRSKSQRRVVPPPLYQAKHRYPGFVLTFDRKMDRCRFWRLGADHRCRKAKKCPVCNDFLRCRPWCHTKIGGIRQCRKHPGAAGHALSHPPPSRLSPPCQPRVDFVAIATRMCPPCGETPPLARRETVAKITIRAVPKQRLIPPFGTISYQMAVSNNTK